MAGQPPERAFAIRALDEGNFMGHIALAQAESLDDDTQDGQDDDEGGDDDDDGVSDACGCGC